MKKTILSLFTIMGFAATAQTLTYANHAPAWGNSTYMMAQCDSLVSPGASGAGASWTFPVNHPLGTKTYTTSNTLPNNASYPSANVSVYSSVSDVSYYNSNTNILKYYGGNLIINSYAINVVYAAPAVYAAYPMSLNTTTSSVTSGTINLTAPFAISQAFTGNCTVLADGTGTLNLPGRSFPNAMRVVTSQTLTASAATVYMLTYDYYAVGTGGSKAPLFSIQTSTINAIAQPSSTQTVAYVQPNYNVVGINESQVASIQLSVYPNPATSIINFATESTDAAKVIALDVTGKTIATETMELGKAKLNLANFSAGVYMYQVVNKNNELLKTGKFSVSK